MAEGAATFKPVPARTPAMQKLKLANQVYRDLVKVKERNLLSASELFELVDIAKGEIEKEFPVEPPAAS